MDDLLRSVYYRQSQGPHHAQLYIEWQKRGAHILLIMEDEDKSKTPKKIHNLKVVIAEIPNPSTNPRSMNKIHGPCGFINTIMEGTGQQA